MVNSFDKNIQYNYFNLKKVYFFLTIFLSLNANCQNITTFTTASLEYDGIGGIGWGVFSIIIALIVGVMCCIFGLSTLYPNLFVAVGFCLPITTLIFMALVPLEQPGNINFKDNTTVNSFVVVKWFFLTLMIGSLFILLIPFMKLWLNMLIPQRVDSRAQREYHEKLEKISKEKEMSIKKNPESGDNNGINDAILPINNEIEMVNLDAIGGVDDGKNDRKKRTMNLRRKKDSETDKNQ